MKGKVRTFNKEKGYGFIACDDKEIKDVFFHYSSLVMDGFKTVDVGAEVEFEYNETEKGPKATRVEVIKK